MHNEALEYLEKMNDKQCRHICKEYAEEKPEKALADFKHIVDGYHLTEEEYFEALELIKKHFNTTPAWSCDDVKKLLMERGMTVDENYDVLGKKYNVYDLTFVSLLVKAMDKHLTDKAFHPIDFIKVAENRLSYNDEYAYEHFQELKEY